MARFGQTTTLTGQAGGTSMFGQMRNTSDQRARQGVPLDWGYRPADRPMAEFLGNGRNFAAVESRTSEGSVRETFSDEYQTLGMAKPKDPTFYRKATGLKVFSWEQVDG